ncbi:aspartyl protease family protein 2-like [Papaver somniferum]|uniref:aspartyl protease family protein 2-like n=1 Tax=Papaver somniferum TaxID=3469 RepID=UPI000E6FE74B|nr:aspartyl protease family protein 2-like [Papaver somniferum]
MMMIYCFPLVLISLTIIVSQCNGFALESSSESKKVFTFTIEPIKMKPSTLAYFQKNPEIYYGLLCDRDNARMNYLVGVGTSMNTSQGGNDIVFKPVSPKTELGWSFSVLVPIGKPLQIQPLLLDTGSGMTWFMCQPDCVRCHPVRQGDTIYPIYDQTKSDTDLRVDCGNEDCESRYSSCVDDDHLWCKFRIDYADNDYAKGDLIYDMLVLGGRENMYPMGCSRDTTYNNPSTSGILGLAQGSLSLAERIIRNYKDLSVFSYCLSPDNSTSLIFSGDYVSMLSSSTKQLSNQEIFYTNMITNPSRPVWYYVDLVGISIGSGEIIEGTEEPVFHISGESGGVFIDSGFTFTTLVPEAYKAVTKAFKEMVSGLSGWVPFRPVGGLSTCYNLSSVSRPIEFHSLNFHFRKAESPEEGRRNYDDDEHFKLELAFDNVMTMVNRQYTNLYCLALTETKSGISIIGMINQRNIRMDFGFQFNFSLLAGTGHG